MFPRRLLLALGLLVIAAALATWQIAPRLLPGLRPPAPAARAGLPPLDRVAAWTGSRPLTADSLRGRAVVLLVWCDTDPRSLAALPVLEAWHRAYAPLGARVFAVHAPEFSFAADTAVTFGLVRGMGLTLPVASDPVNSVQSALGGATDGPHLIVAGEDGVLVVDTVGALGAGELALRQWAARAHPGASPPPPIAIAPPVRTRIVYLGAGRVGNGPLRGLPGGHEENFTAQFRYQEQGGDRTPYPVGSWRTGTDGLTASRGGAANFVAIRYSAGRAGVVVSRAPGANTRLWILRDDQWPRASDRGDDVSVDGRGASYLLVNAPGLYWIDRGEGERVLKLSPEMPGVTLHAFVFEDAR